MLAVLALVLVLAFLGLINSTLRSICAAAVYHCAVTGEACGFFRQKMVEQACRRQG